ncbi:F-box/kelch-repeat protein At3g23880-like [Vicia villosa]|uniref:F-box/kelch-repeat protein At3g23880-like n=1 Tax=Vicia villosa TaxID=3911 RepID=UPI00273B6CA1|nr:F-box/kelch-repeat protein At3g23880-like [Vicia villosa]
MANPIQRPNRNISDSLPTLPSDLIPEVLSRLPVKHLLQFRCVCKLWNSLIFDNKFTRKHLKSTTRTFLQCVSYHTPSSHYILKSFSIQSIFADMATNITQHEFSSKDVFKHKIHDIVGSCDGILCLANYYKPLIVLCNPSIRKFKELSPFDNPRVDSQLNMTCGFGYDHVSHNYKVIVVYNFTAKGIPEYTTNVKVHTLGTNSWKNTRMFPSDTVFTEPSGKYVSGTINWLVFLKGRHSDPPFIVSFDLEKESYQKVFLPDLGEIDVFDLTLGVLRDCLCLIHDDDVWFMREYGIKESWIKLFDLSYLQDSTKPSTLTKVLYLFEDDNVLLEFIYFEKKKLILYNSKNGSFKKGSFKNAAMFQHTLEVCVESLISPCF